MANELEARTESGQDGATDAAERRKQVSRLARSSGGVAFRHVDGSDVVEVALIATRNSTRWQLPKGSCEAGETSVETAVREVYEETGLRTEPVRFLRTIDFWYWDTFRKDPPVRVHKMVDFYLLRVQGGRLTDASHEVDGVGWFSLPEAQRILTYQSERHVLEIAAQLIAQLNR